MRLIQILGTGCPKCAGLFENVLRAVQEQGVDARLEKVADMDQIVAFGVIATPAIVIDGEVKAVGKLLAVPEIKKLLAS